MRSIELSLFSYRLAAICDEMGANLKRCALSPNIRDREDFSCALFDTAGELVAQAAHIPVHLGSMAFAMRDIVGKFQWQGGDEVVFNDPFLGGTHLPDITMVQPVFAAGILIGFSASRAHHTDIGGGQPGSMGLCSRLEDEGVVLSPQLWMRAGRECSGVIQKFLSQVHNPGDQLGDLAAQRSACATGGLRLQELAGEYAINRALAELLTVSETYGRETIASIPDGIYHFSDAMDDDGLGHGPLLIRVSISIKGQGACVDFSGTAGQSPGPVNCPLAVTAAAVFYVFRCLMPGYTPQTSAIFRPIEIRAPVGCLVNAKSGAAVAAGNVETSQRIVDVVLGALSGALPDRIPAASQGTMNNVVFGGVQGRKWAYYETIGGGMGAGEGHIGLDGVQCHMTNTKNSSIEVLEMHYPLRIRQYLLRRGSGGGGRYRGGDGIVREWEALDACCLSLLSERRASRPWGLQGGLPGARGRNLLFQNGQWSEISGKYTTCLERGDRLKIETPGGGGFGSPEQTQGVEV